MAEESKPLSRSEREAHIKDRAGWTITVMAALLAVNTYIANGISSSVLTNTIKANDTWNFYQAKSIKQSNHKSYDHSENNRAQGQCDHGGYYEC